MAKFAPPEWRISLRTSPSPSSLLTPWSSTNLYCFVRVLYDSSERINFAVCIPLLYTRGCLIEILWTLYERTKKGCSWPNFACSHCRSTFRNQQISSVMYENTSITGSFTRGSTVRDSTMFFLYCYQLWDHLFSLSQTTCVVRSNIQIAFSLPTTLMTVGYSNQI